METSDPTVSTSAILGAYVNVSRRTPIIEGLAERTGLPLLHFNLTKGEVRSISGCTLEMLRGKGKENGKK